MMMLPVGFLYMLLVRCGRSTLIRWEECACGSPVSVGAGGADASNGGEEEE
jgi:hypothetical protein